MSGKHFVFLDRNGRRWLWVRVLAGLGFLVLLALLLVFIRALWIKPDIHMPQSLRQLKSQLKAIAPPSPRVASDVKPWLRFQSALPPRKQAVPRPDHARIAAALLTGTDPRNLESLAEHADQLTDVCPEMFVVQGQPAKLVANMNREMLAALRATKLHLVPLLTNLSGAQWDTDAVEGLIQADEKTQQAFFDELTGLLKKAGATAVLIDWQGIDPGLAKTLSTFLGHLRDTLHADGLDLWLSIPVGNDLRAFDLETLPEAVDYLVAQLHDENAEGDLPGPVASQPWFEGWLRTLLAYGESHQWILSLGAYGYDWNKATAHTSVISFSDAMARAERSGVGPVLSMAPDYNPGFTYDFNGEAHEVWFLDATTFANQLRASEQEQCAGVMINQLGLEDPGIRTALAHRSPLLPAGRSLAEMEVMDPHETIAHIGEGDLLQAEINSSPGYRSLWLDEDERICEKYLQWPVFPTVVHFGLGQPDQVALTFDDGPDPKWTPKILDILKEHRVHATFFILGKNAENYPSLVRRIVREGHEIGSHTYTHPNLSEASAEQVQLELNATQRLIEWLTSRSTIFFRPPYNADSMPATLADVQPLSMARDLGYVTAGESIDPEDWERPGADRILQRIKEKRSGGNVILLHDAGGERSQTVEALPKILDYLAGRGDSVVLLGQLLGLTSQETMPPLSETGSTAPRFIANAGLLVLHWGEEFLWAFMIVASVLTILRSLFIAFLALTRKTPTTVSPEKNPAALSVIIAAYNEGKVIAATLRSVLQTTYAGRLEVIVVDDGSTDDTGAQVEQMAARDDRIRLLRQANSGKASALSHGLSVASEQTIVLLDADTQFQFNTLEELIRPLHDAKVGAVSGHARVGNLKTWIARFQSLEYICGFNLDRRAYDCVNAVTVVPGAISAYRREAIEAAGRFSTDTLAEDTDLTLALHRAGWRIAYAPDAIGWTEAPETIRALAKQRFRWAFGTMQCLWKHRDMILNPRRGALGCFSLPSICLFQILLVATIPFVDVLLIISLLTGAGTIFLFYFVAFLSCDFILALIACIIEREPVRRAFWIIPMRFLYRPILSAVVWQSILHILRGAWVGWGKLERKGTVAQPPLEV